jgi:NADPH:quinone reductase-like Zn-dependent oxidoreductase
VKAAIRNRYGSPTVVEVRELDKPAPADGEVLVRVHAASLNMADWYAVMGRPYLGRAQVGIRRPKSNRLGVDYAGTVENVGAGVTQFRPGDEVFGGRDGAYAEYVCAREERSIVPKPENVSFEEAAAVPVAALTALQGLRDKAGLQPGQTVAINGASGGVGTYAIQIAKALGAEVTAVCSSANVDMARSLGADDVVDYTKEDFTRRGRRYDVLLDVAGSRSWWACKRVLEPTGILVIVGGPKENRLLGPLGHVVKLWLGGKLSRRSVVFFIAKFDKADMLTLRELLEGGKVKSVVDRRYELSEIGDAFRYLGEGHARGKVVVSLDEANAS